MDFSGLARVPRVQWPESQQSDLDARTIVIVEEDRALIAALPKIQRSVSPALNTDQRRAARKRGVTQSSNPELLTINALGVRDGCGFDDDQARGTLSLNASQRRALP